MNNVIISTYEELVVQNYCNKKNCCKTKSIDSNNKTIILE